MKILRQREFGLYADMNERKKQNQARATGIVKSDFKNGNILTGIKHSFYLDKTSRDKFDAGVY